MDGKLCFYPLYTRLYTHMCIPYTYTDTALEIENISNCGDDLETDEPLVESIAAASLDHNNAEIMPIQETRAQPSQSQQTSVVPDDHMPVSTATQLSTSARSTTDVSPNSPRGTMTEPAGNDGNRTTISARIQPRIQQSHTQLEENTARNGGAQNTQEDHIQRQDRLIEEPPPLYSNLFSPSYVHNATNNCDSRCISLQANCCNEHHNRPPPSTVPRHSLCQDPSCLQHCYPPPFPHSSHHHTILPLPGEIGQHPAHYHTQMAVRSQSLSIYCVAIACACMHPSFYSHTIPLFYQCTIVALNLIKLVQKTISNSHSFV